MRLRSSLLAIAIGVGLVVSGCATSGNTIDGSQVGPSPVVLEDSSPAQLGVFVSLNIGGYDVASRNQAVLDINFQHAGSPVAFIADERVTCNGVTLKRFQGGLFEFHFAVDPLPVVPAGIACTYSSDGHSAALSVPVPPMLKVVLPTDHERVSRGPHTLVQFSRPQQAGLWVVALSVNAKAAGEVQEMTPPKPSSTPGNLRSEMDQLP